MISMYRLITGILYLFFIVTASALEPPNIHFFKHKLIHYHDSGKHDHDIAKVAINAKKCLKMQTKNKEGSKKLALVLDIDDTSLSSYYYESESDFSFDQQKFKYFVEKANMPAIPAILDLYRLAKKRGMAVFFISGRRESWRDVTVKNLRAAGYKDWDGLYLRPDDYSYDTIVPFKLSTRELLRSKGYEIVGNIGDQESDLTGDHVGCRFKIPNPYYFVADEEEGVVM